MSHVRSLFVRQSHVRAIDNEEEGSGGRDENKRNEPASCHISIDSITESSAAMVSADWGVI
jgi:hypothetical protein